MSVRLSTILCIIIAIVLIVVSITVYFISSFNDKEYVVTVTRVGTIIETTDSKVQGKYLVYCEDENGNVIVFENSDNLLRGKINSSDMYAQLEEGHKYRLTVVGWRIQFFSTYQNIIKVREV